MAPPVAGFGIVCCGISGIAILAVCIHMLTRANDLEPTKDFEYLGRVCSITNFTHSWRTNEIRDSTYPHTIHYSCQDTYHAIFEVPSSSGLGFEKAVTARGETFRRGNSKCDEEGEGFSVVCPYADCSFQIDDLVDCWKPADGGK